MSSPDVLATVRQRVQSVSDTPSLDAQVLLANILGKGRTWVLTHPEVALTAQQASQLEDSIERYLAGEPLPYILGHWEFYNLDLLVNQHVLIPRPETELLVTEALQWLQKQPTMQRVVDSGTGSGNIAIALATSIAGLAITAVDVSLSALKVARENARRHSVAQRISFVQADLLPPAKHPFDLICANLPYIPRKTLVQLAVFHREPSLALDGGANGLAVIQRLLNMAPARLAKGGLMLLEIEASQGQTAVRLARKSFPEAKIRLLRDLAGLDRLVAIES